ncbi:polyphosphate polymerase domain-containing protein [Flavobacteriales bacterium]|nr:polyphosphate polymerase domain-containing protein [Flavobacteriales bacterium]
MNEISKITASFSPIKLAEMDNVKLMSRSDTKFAFKFSKLPELLNQMMPFYKVLEINGKFIHDYNSLYFDTDDRKFYLDHHNGRVNRNKVRFREYVGSDLTFLEIKRKNNKGKTIKKRMKVDSINDNLSVKQKEYIYSIIGSNIILNSKQWINFSRITFVHKVHKERLTIDINLNFKEKDRRGDLNQIAIGEVKQERMSRLSDFMRIAKELHILPIRISKYCMSTLELNPELKQNRFKEKTLFLTKLKNL